MKRMITSILLSLSGLGGFCLSSCTLPEGASSLGETASSVSSASSVSDKVPVVEIKKNAYGASRLFVEGHPFLLRGAQIRLDGLTNRGSGIHEPPSGAPKAKTIEECEPYFAAASEFGFNTVEVPLSWRDLEPKEGIYDFSSAEKILTLAERHSLKVEFLWYSYNMCGDSHSFSIPSYIFDDESRFPVYEQKDPAYFSWMYGDTKHLVVDTPLLLEKEALVLQKLNAAVFSWSEGHSNVLIGIQIHNEADGLLRWRLAQQKLALQGVPLDSLALWKAILHSLDNAGSAWKKGPYPAFTRVNLTTAYSVQPFAGFEQEGCSPKDVYDLSGIDLIGDDPYVESPSAISKDVESFYSLEGNVGHIAENMGAYANTASLMLAAFCKGGGYAVYDLATPEFFTYMNQSSYRMDQGILNTDLSYKSHSLAVKRLLQGIADLGELPSLVDQGDFLGFNLATNDPQISFQETLRNHQRPIECRFSEGGVALSLEYEDYGYFYSTEPVEWLFPEGGINYNYESGSFLQGVWNKKGEGYWNDALHGEAGVLYRLKVHH